VLDKLKLSAEVSHKLVDKRFTIVSHNVSGTAILVDDMCLNEIDDILLLDFSQRDCFCLFRKVINCRQDVQVASGRLCNDKTHNIKPRSFKD